MAKEKNYRIKETVNKKGESSFVVQYQTKSIWSMNWYNIVPRHRMERSVFKSLKKAKKALKKYKGKQFNNEIIHNV